MVSFRQRIVHPLVKLLALLVIIILIIHLILPHVLQIPLVLTVLLLEKVFGILNRIRHHALTVSLDICLPHLRRHLLLKLRGALVIILGILSLVVHVVRHLIRIRSSKLLKLWLIGRMPPLVALLKGHLLLHELPLFGARSLILAKALKVLRVELRWEVGRLVEVVVGDWGNLRRLNLKFFIYRR